VTAPCPLHHVPACHECADCEKGCLWRERYIRNAGKCVAAIVRLERLEAERDELAARLAEVTAERDELLHWRGITERIDAVTAQALDMMNRALADTTRERDEARSQLTDALRLGLDERERLRTALRMSPDILRITRHSIAQLQRERDAARAEVERLRETITEMWHTSPDARELHQALGMTPEQYARWVELGRPRPAGT
jgi:DNA repair exonuclease SbcCD ATPase subunit